MNKNTYIYTGNNYEKTAIASKFEQLLSLLPFNLFNNSKPNTVLLC